MECSEEPSGQDHFSLISRFFIQACHDAKVDPYTILKFVGHDDKTEAKTSEVHRNYMSCDLTPDEVIEIDRVKVPIGPIGPILPFGKWLKRQ